jgi:hypothetical protein
MPECWQAEFAGAATEFIEIFLHGVANENERTHFESVVFAPRMRQNLGDLRLPAAAIDARHQFAEPLWLGDPSRCAAFGKPSVIDELKIESADGGRFPKHFCLELTRLVPSRLPAHCGVEREDEPPSLTGFDCGIERSNLAQKRLDVGAR